MRWGHSTISKIHEPGSGLASPRGDKPHNPGICAAHAPARRSMKDRPFDVTPHAQKGRSAR